MSINALSWSDMPHAVDAHTGALIPGRTMNGTPYPHYAAQLPSPSSTVHHMTTSAYPPWAHPVTPVYAPSFGLPSPYTPMSPGYISPSPVTPLSYPPSFPAQPVTSSPFGLTSSPSLDSYGYPLALSRTPSNGVGKKKRSGSHGRSYLVKNDYQLWKGPDAYSLKNLAKRPRDWRSDYNPRSGIASYIITLSKNPSDVPEFTDPVKRTLNALLLFKPAEPAMYWNLRRPATIGDVEFNRLNRSFNQIDLLQLATSPAADQMRLCHPKLPWYIDVFKTHPNGITIGDLLHAIHSQLSTQIRPRHYYNEELDDVHRGVLYAAYCHRCEGRRELAGRGILQVDFLANKYVLLGLVKGKNGMWEMKTGEDG